MKNFIYLSILSVLIVLSSCKGNSFLSQKYTHFGHGHKHGAIKEGVALKNKKSEPATVALVQSENTNPVLTDAALSPVVYSHQDVAKNTQATQTSYKSKALPQNASNKAISNTRNLSSSNLLTQQKVNTQSKHTYKAIIGEILGLVIWIIMVCVLVAAILLLVILL